MIWKVLLLSVLLLVAPLQSQAAVVFDAFGFSDDVSTPPNPSTFSITLGTGIKCVQVQSFFRSDTTVNVTAATIGGEAMALVSGSKTHTSQIYGETWGGTTALTGTQTVSVSWTGSPTVFAGGAISATNCDSVTNGNAATSGYPLLLTITSADGDLSATALYTWNSAGAASTNKTIKWVTTHVSSGGGDIGSGTSNPTHSWSAFAPWLEAVVTGANFRAGASVPDTIPPTTPTNLVASSISTTSLTYTWTASTDNIAVIGYRFELASFSGSCGTFVEIAQPITTSYVVTGLTPGTTYCVRIRASDNTPNLSAYSSTVTTATLSPRTATLNWIDTAPNTQNQVPETGFEIWGCPGLGCSNFQPIASVGPNVTQYVDVNSPAPVGGYKVTALPAGSGFTNTIYTTPSNPTAVLAVIPPTLTFTSTVGTNPSSQSLTISSGGATGMDWTVSDNAAWLSVAPSSGTDGAVLVVSVDQTGLASGTHFATITITAPGANNSPTNIAVTLSLSPVTTPSTGSSGRIR